MAIAPVTIAINDNYVHKKCPGRTLSDRRVLWKILRHQRWSSDGQEVLSCSCVWCTAWLTPDLECLTFFCVPQKIACLHALDLLPCDFELCAANSKIIYIICKAEDVGFQQGGHTLKANLRTNLVLWCIATVLSYRNNWTIVRLGNKPILT